LIDQRVGDKINGPHFNHVPYHYGPFDPLIYNILENLNVKDEVDIKNDGNYKTYRLTVIGQRRGESLFNNFNPELKNYLTGLIDFVLSLSFRELIMTIYREFPDMRVNSVFSY